MHSVVILPLAFFAQTHIYLVSTQPQQANFQEVSSVIKVLIEGRQEDHSAAAESLKYLAMNMQNTDDIREKGGIQALIGVLHRGIPDAQAKAAGALGMLAQNHKNQDMIRQE